MRRKGDLRGRWGYLWDAMRDSARTLDARRLWHEVGQMLEECATSAGTPAKPGPKGDKGDPGDDGTAATIAVGTVATGDPGDPAVVTNVGTTSAAVFDFSIPQGEQGDPGEGVPVGGNTGMALVKSSLTDYDTAWAYPSIFVTDGDYYDSGAIGIEFVGATVSAGDISGVKVTIDGGGGSIADVTDTTTTVSGASELRFVGATVSPASGGTAAVVTIDGGGSPEWGDITGTLSDQTDLQAALDGKQATITGLTASGAELNILDGATLTTTELNYVDGVTSAIQTQLDAKLPTTVTTKGDLIGFSTVPTRVAVGADGYVLTADAASAAGFKWAAGGGGGGSGSGGIAGAYDIEKGGSPVFTDLGLSDEFTGSSINSNWTVTNASPGTVNPLSTVSGVIYDLSTRDKGLLIQSDNTTTEMRLRGNVIGANEQLIMSFSMPFSGDAAAYGYYVNMSVNTSTSSPTSGTFHNIIVRNSTSAANNFYISTGGTSVSSQDKLVYPTGHRMYLRYVMLTGGTIHVLWSFDGIAWVHQGTKTFTPSYIWVSIGSNAYTRGAADPVACINWIRHCAYTGLDPW